jgi:phosphohistidine swiveling domain-containing protein
MTALVQRTESVRAFSKLEIEQGPLPDGLARTSCAGGKGETLARLYQAGYPVPNGFIVLPGAFAGDELTSAAWTEIQKHLARMRREEGKTETGKVAFAVRSSALSEDSAQASFAGEFETVLDVRTDELIQAAIHTVRRSRHSERVRAYSKAKGIEAAHDVAVVVQRLVRADISGVLFTADPVSGSHMHMTGNFVFGFGEELVSGEAEPYTFSFERPRGKYDGPASMKRFARKLYKLAVRLERELGCPQDIEWAVAGGNLFLLQSRPITTLVGYDPATGAWNDSLTGDFVWSRNNFGEARPDVMSPFTFSVSEKVWGEASFLPGYHMAGNICGRYYANISVAISMLRAMGKSQEAALEQMGNLLGNVPEGLEVPLVPLPRSAMLLALPRMIKLAMKESQGAKKIPEYLATNPGRCRELRRRIQQTQTGAELLSLWHEEFVPEFSEVVWIMGGSAKPLEASMKLKRELAELVGEADANSLFSNLSSESELMASLGPVVGVAKVARGEMSREEYLEKYGHRGPHEAEISMPRPAEDPDWLDRQLEEYQKNPVDVDALLAKRRAEFEAAWERLQERYPKKANRLRGEIEKIGPAARMREAVRDEITRFLWVEREWALRAGALTGLGDDIFFLTLDEVLALLSGKDTATKYIPARKETYARYRELPPYPMIIRGRFDPFQWVADPERRGRRGPAGDIYDAHAPVPAAASDTITGFAGAAGRVEGSVRVLDGPEQGDQLQPGEILVAVTTNVGWTPLFPRAAAVVTDVGAPLSHAAIVARELGIPAVVGCGSATTRLRTGDRVRVDGGQGTVEILSLVHAP